MSRPDFAGRLERIAENVHGEVTKLAEEMLADTRPVFSEPVNEELDAAEWSMEDEEAKKVWIQQKAAVYGRPRALAMFLQREARHEKRLDKEIPVTRNEGGDGA